MATSASDIIDRARRLLEDIGPQYKWRDVELITYVNDGQREICMKSPHAMIMADESVIPVPLPTEITALVDELQISDMYLGRLTDWVVARALEKRAAFAPDGKAAYHRALVEATV